MSTPQYQPRGRASRLLEPAIERVPLSLVPRRRPSAPRVPFATLIATLLVGGVVGLLLFNTHMQQGSFVASALEERAAILAGNEESLRMQVHRLRDPQHVAARARRLGMVPSTSPAFIRLSDGKVLGKPVPAARTDVFPISPLPPTRPRAQIVVAEPEKSEGRAR